jgi:hypothetical protein
MQIMRIRQRLAALGRIPAVRTSLFCFGWVLIACAPLAGILPGPGGIILFGAGAGLVLKYSASAKRKYVHLKRGHPKKGAWADWGLRRKSARRRLARDGERIAAVAAQGN